MVIRRIPINEIGFPEISSLGLKTIQLYVKLFLWLYDLAMDRPGGRFDMHGGLYSSSLNKRGGSFFRGGGGGLRKLRTPGETPGDTPGDIPGYPPGGPPGDPPGTPPGDTPGDTQGRGLGGCLGVWYGDTFGGHIKMIGNPELIGGGGRRPPSPIILI